MTIFVNLTTFSAILLVALASIAPISHAQGGDQSHQASKLATRIVSEQKIINDLVDDITTNILGVSLTLSPDHQFQIALAKQNDQRKTVQDILRKFDETPNFTAWRDQRWGPIWRYVREFSWYEEGTPEERRQLAKNREDLRAIEQTLRVLLNLTVEGLEQTRTAKIVLENGYLSLTETTLGKTSNGLAGEIRERADQIRSQNATERANSRNKSMFRGFVNYAISAYDYVERAKSPILSEIWAAALLRVIEATEQNLSLADTAEILGKYISEEWLNRYSKNAEAIGPYAQRLLDRLEQNGNLSGEAKSKASNLLKASQNLHGSWIGCSEASIEFCENNPVVVTQVSWWGSNLAVASKDGNVRLINSKTNRTIATIGVRDIESTRIFFEGNSLVIEDLHTGQTRVYDSRNGNFLFDQLSQRFLENRFSGLDCAGLVSGQMPSK